MSNIKSFQIEKAKKVSLEKLHNKVKKPDFIYSTKINGAVKREFFYKKISRVG
jgi:hypothetical protein